MFVFLVSEIIFILRRLNLIKLAAHKRAQSTSDCKCKQSLAVGDLTTEKLLSRQQDTARCTEGMWLHN
jgi:hypothetical protein